MSGVRIYNPELLALGMTLPGFIERGKVIASLPSLGVLTLAGHTPSDWAITYREVDSLESADLSGLPELVAISSLTARINDAYRLADELRSQGKRVVIGGLHASLKPEEASEHTDVVVVGEGEGVWRDLLCDYLKGELKPIYRSMRNRSFEPWALPRYDLLDPTRYNRITIQTTRGCPLDCAFCGASRLISDYKRKSIEHVNRELDAIEAIWPKPFIELADDNTFVHKPWARQLVEAIGNRGIRWFTESDISLADDDHLLRDLAASGCMQVLIGLETVDENALEEADSKHWKRRRRSKYIEAIQKIQDHGISVNGCFIFGFDNHDASVFEETSRFIEDADLSEVQVTVLTPFPGTALHQRLETEGRLLRPVFWDQCTLFDVTFQPAKMSVKELESGFSDLVRDVYGDAKTIPRKSRFQKCVRKAVKTHA